MSKGGKAIHKADAKGGSYDLLPRVTTTALLRSSRFRELAVMLAILQRFNGYNNGSIGLSMRDLGEAIGSPNNAANARAIAWLVNAGYVWIGADYPRGKRKAREYGLTFISSGTERAPVRATHDYLETEKLRGAETSPRTPLRGYVSDTDRKRRGFVSDTGATETSHVSTPSPVLDSDTHIVSHTRASAEPDENTPSNPLKYRAAFPPSAAMPVDELRDFARSYIGWAPAGAQSQLAHDASIPGGTLSKFLNGRGLPDAYAMSLQLAIGRSFPTNERTNNGRMER